MWWLVSQASCSFLLLQGDKHVWTLWTTFSATYTHIVSQIGSFRSGTLLPACQLYMCDLIIAYIDATLVGAANWVTTNRKRFHLLWKQFAICLLHKIHFWSNSQKFSPVKETRYMAPSHSTLIVVSRWLALALILSRFSSQPTNYGQAYWSRYSLGVLSQNDHSRGVISWDHSHLVTHHGWLADSLWRCLLI